MPIELQTNIALECEPQAPEHLVNMKWVTDFFTGRVKAPVRLVSTDDLAGTYTAASHEFELTASGLLEIDGVNVAAGDRILLVGQSDLEENGIYVVTDPGNGGPALLTRAPDFTDVSQIFTGVTIAVNAGDEHANSTWKLITDPIVAGGPLEFIPMVPTTGATKFVFLITPDGTEKEWDAVHNLGTRDVVTQLQNLSTHGLVMADINTVDNNTLEVAFCSAPSAAEGPYSLTVIG